MLGRRGQEEQGASIEAPGAGFPSPHFNAQRPKEEIKAPALKKDLSKFFSLFFFKCALGSFLTPGRRVN